MTISRHLPRFRAGRQAYSNIDLPFSRRSSSSLARSSALFSLDSAVASRRATCRDSMYRLDSARSFTKDDEEEMSEERIPNSQAFWDMRDIRARRLHVSYDPNRPLRVTGLERLSLTLSHIAVHQPEPAR